MKLFKRSTKILNKIGHEKWSVKKFGQKVYCQPQINNIAVVHSTLSWIFWMSRMDVKIGAGVHYYIMGYIKTL